MTGSAMDLARYVVDAVVLKGRIYREIARAHGVSQYRPDRSRRSGARQEAPKDGRRVGRDPDGVENAARPYSHTIDVPVGCRGAVLPPLPDPSRPAPPRALSGQQPRPRRRDSRSSPPSEGPHPQGRSAEAPAVGQGLPFGGGAHAPAQALVIVPGHAGYAPSLAPGAGHAQVVLPKD